jgi:hypothetical protein
VTGVAGDTARGRQAAGEFLAQEWIALQILGEERALAQRLEQRGAQTADQPVVRLGDAVHEVDGAGRPVTDRGHRPGRRPRQPAPGPREARVDSRIPMRARRTRARRRARDGRPVIPPAQAARDEGAGPLAAHEIAFQPKLFVRQEHDVPRAAGIARQVARGGRAAARCQDAAPDQRHERAGDLRVAGTAVVKRQHHR